MTLKIITGYFQIFQKSFFQALGLLSSVFTITAIFCEIKSFLLIILVASFMLSVAYALFKTWPCKKISFCFHNNIKLNIELGDIFEHREKDIVVIPVNSYFDTVADDKIIAKNTVHGKFLEYYGKNGDIKELRNLIASYLKEKNISPISNNNSTSRLPRYPLGTVAEISDPVKDENRIFYLVASTDFDDNNHVIPNPGCYFNIMIKLLVFIDIHNNGWPIFLPLIGAGQAGLNVTKKDLLQAMINAFIFCPHYTATAGTSIIIKENDNNEVPLKMIKYVNNDYNI